MGIVQHLSGSRLTINDIIFLILKLVVSCVIIFIFGVLFGFLLIIFINWVIDFAIRKIYKLQPLNSTDKNSFYDQESNRCNIMAALIFEKCDEEVLKEIFGKKMPEKWCRFRSCMKKVLDQYYFKELSPSELRSQLEFSIVTLNNINSME